MKSPNITLTDQDYERITAMLEHIDSLGSKESNLEDLENEIDRAVVVPSLEVSRNIVTMGSRLRYLFVAGNQTREITVVYPHEADREKHFVSVTAPLGAALLGLKAGDEITWNLPEGKQETIRLLEVLDQPEARAGFPG